MDRVASSPSLVRKKKKKKTKKEKEISYDAEELFQPRELCEILIDVITGVPRGSRYLGIPERQASKTETARIRVSV